MKNNIFNILKKELREVFRDKKSLSMMLVIPFMIPLIIIGMSALFNSEQDKPLSDYNRIGFAYELSNVEENIIKELEIDSVFGSIDELEQKYDNEELSAALYGSHIHPEAHNAYGALVDRKAVCDGFSSAYALIAQYFGFKCMVVDGKSAYNQNAKIDHAWNIVEYQGEYFHIDVTWDANTYETTKAYSYDYFGLDDDAIAVDHEWNFKKTPKCNSDKLSYFIINRLYAFSESQIEEILSGQFKKKDNTIRIKISPGIAFEGDGTKFMEGKMLSAASRVGLTCEFN